VLAFKIQLVMASDEVLDDVSAHRMGSKVRRQVARAAGTVVSSPTVGNQRMSANEVGMVGTARHRRAVRGNVISEMRARRTAGIHQRVMTRAQINRVVAETALIVCAETFVMGLTTAVAPKSMPARTTIGTTKMSMIGGPTAIAKTSRSMLMARRTGVDWATPVSVAVSIQMEA